MSDLVITMNKKLDRLTINNLTTIQFVNNYAAEAPTVTDTTYADLSAGDKEDLAGLLDFYTWQIEENALVWDISRDGKTFRLTDSYVRDEEDTTAPRTALTAGDVILARFEVPGFTAGEFREVNVFYDQAFNPAELTALEEIGIEISGNGKVFTITNIIECKVTFSKPIAVTDFYIINDVGANDVIAV